MDNSPEAQEIIYHEKQMKELCALHALNNLFQNPKTFSKADLDEICINLSPQTWLNPHRSILGLGNYDINVIMTALQKKGFESNWFDRRKDPKCIDQQKVEGYILNIPSQFKIGKYVPTPIKRRHWLTVRNINGIYYNLDSKLDSPEHIGREEDLVEYLRDVLSDIDKELFVVTRIENSKSYFKENS
ncbi:hypothetical protein M8J75_007944 [Diaphorina citri]|nr:hypothetical protein M8J75_007944 [Diaphorina citri]